ncbi:MAG: efflux RND transporter permease subunit [Bacteroidetes bacterium]|jgi:HAE1 family hydrophobic/amphiphilic exporter-1|nr:efflux RND transporter permease subunit [Bacteroidota bacterium]
MSFTELVVKRPTLVVVIFTVLGILGFFGYRLLKYELLPDVSFPAISVVTVYPGASPSEVENNLTRKIEDATSTISDLNFVKSQSLQGFSFVQLEFDYTADIDVVTQDVQRKINEIKDQLPDQAEEPLVIKFAFNEMPILRLGVSQGVYDSSKVAGKARKTLTDKELYQLVKDQIAPQLNKISGTGQITLIGGDEREIRVNVDTDKLKAYGLSLANVVQTLQTGNLDFPTGDVKTRDNQLVVRVAGKEPQVSRLGDLRVVTPPGYAGEVYVRDLAEVVDGTRDYQNINRINGLNSIGMQIQKQSDANAVETAKMLRQEMARLETEYAQIGLKFDIAQDGTEFTIEAADAVEHDLMMAILLVALVMFLFLHSIRDSFIVMVSLPSSIISVFLVMYVLDFSLNLMTLLALSLVVGILVDDSIVVLENIHRHMEMGKTRRRAAVDGRNEIGFTAMSITLVDVVVFLPLALVGGMIGNIMREFSIVVVFSTLMSLFVSFTVTPVLASRFSKAPNLQGPGLMNAFGRWFEAQFGRLVDLYDRFLRLSLRRKRYVVLVASALFFLSFFIAGRYIGFEFIKQADRGQFSLLVELPNGTPLARTNLLSQQVEQALLRDSLVTKVIAKVGASDEGFDFLQGTSYYVDMTVQLVDQDKRKDKTLKVSQRLKNELARQYPGVDFKVRQIGIFGTADEDPVQYIVSGANRDSVAAFANRLAEMVRKSRGAVDVDISTKRGSPELNVDVDKQKMSELGITTADVGTVLQTALTGFDEVKFRDRDTEYDIRVMVDAFDRQSEEDLGNLTVLSATGEAVKLKDIARISRTEGPAKLERYGRIPSVTVKSQVMGVTEGDVDTQVRAQLAEAGGVPPGIKLDVYGNLKNGADAGSSMGLALLVGITFMYLIMVALYNSYFTPFVVMFSLPLALIGAFLAVGLAKDSLSIFTMLGLIMLMGLVAKNAILLVDFANAGIEKGMSVLDALVEAGRERLRPIFMTTFAMVFGMLPIALAAGAGAEWKRGLAWALIGGLTSSMFLTLIVVPVVYKILHGWREFFRRKLGRSTPHTEEEDVEQAVEAALPS